MREKMFARCCTAVVLAASAQGIGVTPIFRDHAVFQAADAEKSILPARLSGWAATASANLTLTASPAFDPPLAPAVVDPVTGDWSIAFPPGPAGPFALSLLLDGDEVAQASDVYLGEVFLCSGQSNMVFSTESIEGADAVLATADRPLVRLFSVPTSETFPDPVNRVAPNRSFPPVESADLAWSVASNVTVAPFSAVC